LHKTTLLCEKAVEKGLKNNKLKKFEKKVGIFGGLWGKFINFAGEV